MKIGIIIYSETGNTLSVGVKLKEELELLKIDVNLHNIELTDDSNARRNIIKFKDNINLDSYDMLIFGSPVQAFSLSLVMSKYLKEANLNNKKVMCFVTQAFPFSWMGGNRAIKQMNNICLKKDAEIINNGIINWYRKDKEERVEKLIKRMCNLIK